LARSILKKESAARVEYEKKRVKESAAAGAAASADKKKRKPLSPERLGTDMAMVMELEALHQETVQKTAQIIDAIRSFDIYALSWVEHNLKECKKRFKKEYARKTQYIKFFAQKNKPVKTGKKK
jgi:pyruvate/2-oxoglutarate dehydrogenase complex dihydrolipoamide acyltransferase (E2) component